MARWRKPKWGSTEWTHPDGRSMDVPHGIVPHVVTVELADGTTRDKLVPLEEGDEVTGMLLDSERWEKARECRFERTYHGDPCSDWTCGECGKTYTWHNLATLPERCPRCGARCVAVDMEPWDSMQAPVEMRER